MDANSSQISARARTPVFFVAVAVLALVGCGGSTLTRADEWRFRGTIAEEFLARNGLCELMGDVTPQQHAFAERDAQATADALVALAHENPDRVYRGRTVRTIVGDELEAYVSGCGNKSDEIIATLQAGVLSLE